jgi:predicted HTH transcriptional regulator
MAAGLVFLASGAAAAFWLVRKYQHKLRDLSREDVRGANFESIVRRFIEQGEGQGLEFKSTMRMNLRTGKHGKEVEVAWLKAVAAFMNTDGGSLLLGVDDEGAIVGLEADGFESDDRLRLHFKNLVGQHIGLEFSELLRFHVGSIDGKKVALVE